MRTQPLCLDVPDEVGPGLLGEKVVLSFGCLNLKKVEQFFEPGSWTWSRSLGSRSSSSNSRSSWTSIELENNQSFNLRLDNSTCSVSLSPCPAPAARPPARSQWTATTARANKSLTVSTYISWNYCFSLHWRKKRKKERKEEKVRSRLFLKRWRPDEDRTLIGDKNKVK